MTFTQDLRVEVLEDAGERRRTGEEGAFQLPEADFEDGLLGIADESGVEQIQTELLAEGRLHEDEDFPADMTSIFISNRKDNDDITWMRPHELVDDPTLFVDGAHRRDVVQGSLGDCWFLSSCAAVARKTKLIERVVPPNQFLHGDNYCGLIVCRFWRFGEWVTVCVDDRLPTRHGKLIFARSAEASEFWVALLEKAYAKLHGSYEAMEGGQSMDAMVDLTGGLAERYDLDEAPDGRNKNKLYKLLLTASKNGAFITASRKGDWRQAYQTDENGLVEGHAYTVSGVARIRHDDAGLVQLIRVRNPWANGAEWSGGWADGDPKWEGVSEDQKEKLGCTKLSDGEFWMEFHDFWNQFEEVSLCTMGPDYDKDGLVDQVGKVQAIKGEWVCGVTAGGSRNDFASFATNPQILLSVQNESDDEDDDKCSVLVGLLQEHRRSQRALGVRLNQIGFVVYKTENPDEPLPEQHFMYNYDTGSSGTYINYREVLTRLELTSGHYVIIPATYEPDCPGRFMVRVYSPRQFELKSL
ncbi:calpain-B-like [Oratosquilla oratoria]|uniref:calpain-B-like n=1 Tax=Oratosquilla oratoria TaxID=337810 RepID=UPI003F761F08